MADDATPSRQHPPTLLVHATTVAIGPSAVLLCGPSGTGKSDLALRFLAETWPIPTALRRLVSDDQTRLTLEAGRLIASAPDSIAGKLEVRGLGIVDVPTAPPTEVRMVVDLIGIRNQERLPEAQESAVFLGVTVPRHTLVAVEPSAPIKLALLLDSIVTGRLAIRNE